LAVTSRRTSQAATRALQAVLDQPHRVYAWQAVQEANPYRALLAQADVLIVTGESESMLAEAAATTAPVYIYPVREIKADRISSRLREWSVRRANTCFTTQRQPRSLSGAVDAGCAWLMRRGLLRPRRDLNLLHQALYASGRAHPFGDPLVTDPRPPLPEAQKAACWLKHVLRRFVP
jgi:hypothetical protein